VIDFKSPALNTFCDLLCKEHSLLIEGLWEAPKAALIALASITLKKPIVIVTSESKENRLLDDLTYFGIDSALDFPSWETLPGEEIAPSPDIVGKRLETLKTLLEKKTPPILLCSLQACLQKLPALKNFENLCKVWKKGDEIPFETIPVLLTSLGYKRLPIASDKGQFAVRGGIIDLFPVSAPAPFRLEFFGDVLEEIRTYDPIGQRSIEKMQTVLITPASELQLLEKEKSHALLFDYLGKEPLVILNDLLAIEDRYVALKKMPGLHSPFFLSFEEWMSQLKKHQVLLWTQERVEELSEVQVTKKVGRAFYSGKEPLQPLSFHIFDQEITTKRWLHPFREISDFFSASENKAATTSEEIVHGLERYAKSNLEVHFLCQTESEERSLKERLASLPLPPKTTFEKGYLSSGYVTNDSGVVLLPMTEFTHRYKTRRQKWRNTYHTPPSDFHELAPGDTVVHFHQGIGKYLGVEKKPNHLGHPSEFMVLEYAQNSKFYVPIAQSHLVSRYIGAKEETPTLSVLGTNRWQRTREHAQKAIIGYAQDLLRINAERTLHGGFCFPEDSADVQAFEDDFPFVETEDQLKAVVDLKQDMCSGKAMDRLICGDVGYGKTEVAMRAAFKAVLDGKKQVAVLVPTTVLAMQHFETFSDRMTNYPVRVGVLSRFCSAKEVKETLKGVAEGSIDILIGTHRIISKDVKFKDLGLLIIDEEQRFGVRAKESLKALKTGVDCLTLSATPIPRTLYMSLIGAREISVINTPPQDRLPIKTILAERDPSIIQNALLRELSREGQAFFIHNRVETIFDVSEQLQKLVPEARITVGHGQMSSDELDIVFHAFKSGQTDILVTTTIIENGIDIPNANTILVDRADRFGLADLYQLRGRVGRWNRPAYAYFLTPQQRELPELTRKRLHALMEASGYGGGMKIAMRDLEIRGAGDILGTQQSGQISAIGFHLYCKLLKRTIDAMQKKIPPSFTETRLEFSYEASLPESYIDAPSLRMEIYHRLGDATSLQEVETLLSELKDRFGPPPTEVMWLYHLTRLRIFASTLHLILLKFETYTFVAEMQKGKTSLKKSFALPRTKKPEELEKQVIALLQEAFA
jgi:transcription-repair coupling factor (superfamily II helicase)